MKKSVAAISRSPLRALRDHASPPSASSDGRQVATPDRRGRSSRRWCRGGAPAGRRPGRRRGQERHLLLEQVGRLEVAVAGERADGDVVAAVADVRQVGQPADVDEHRRLGEPQLHQRQQRVPAGEELGVVAVLGRAGEAPRRPSRPVRSRTRRGSRRTSGVGLATCGLDRGPDVSAGDGGHGDVA